MSLLARAGTLQFPRSRNPRPPMRSSSPLTTDTTGHTTEQVFQRHLQAFVGRDFDRLELDYAPDAMLLTNLGTFRGRQQIRSFFVKLLSEILPEGSTFNFQQQVVEGEVAFLVWSASAPAFDLPFVTDTYIIRNGAIVLQTGAGAVHPRASA